LKRARRDSEPYRTRGRTQVRGLAQEKIAAKTSQESTAKTSAVRHRVCVDFHRYVLLLALDSYALGHNERNVIMLLVRAEPPYFFHNRIQQGVGRQIMVPAQSLDQALFSELFSRAIE
jgi:hypothetical protein